MKPQVWIGAYILVVPLTSVIGQAPVTVKTWTFTLPHGTLSIDLQSHPDAVSSLRIGPNGQGLEAPIAEQVEPLKQVLQEMLALGWDPQKLASLSTRIYGQDVRNKLAYACVDSRDWHLSMRNKGKDKEQIIIGLLNQSGAYERYNEAFNIYGIRVQVTEAEKVSLKHFSSFPQRNSRDRAYARTLVPTDASLGMSFSKVDSTPE
ncbi:MAG: hypothetical protein WBQ89_28400 [Candidatus Acidiferrum sp.]